ncbi:8-oxo-dGTP diphosphatase MutT [Halioxenophilus aromaticivorans]|uniref:8-oxo-dGTP diphosphatase n=1 Tax=Halioxenophilus aromaticivorans TaxID=1306992 RepID=A0AAV3TYX9_9ALTE
MSQPAKKVVHVAVGVVVQNQCVLLAKRAQHQHQGGLWEFPGGKVEPNESVAHALTRELQEELAIQVENCQPLMEIRHDYSDKSVMLDVWVVDAFTGEPKGVEGQPLTWASAAELGDFDFPEANVAIVEKVRQLLQG